MRGAGMRVLWIGPQGSVYYPAYEAVQRLPADAPRVLDYLYTCDRYPCLTLP